MAPNREKSNRELEGRQTIQLMKRIMIHLRGQMDELLRPQGLTTAQLVMLRAVQNSPGSSGAQLARECYVTPQSAQASIKQLEALGLIVRGKDPINERIVTARVSPAGERLLANAEKSAESLQGRLWRDVSDRDIAGLKMLLERCLANIDENGNGLL